MARAIDFGLPARRTVRFGGAWGWALAGLLVVVGAVAFDPGAERPAADGSAVVGASAPEDWRGNSARLPALR